MTDLIDTTEMYLRTILELEEEGIRPDRFPDCGSHGEARTAHR